MTTEEIVSKYGGSYENVKESIKLQQMIENYVILLQTKVRNGEITPGSCIVSLPPVKLFCEMNDIILNWRKIDKLLPHGNANTVYLLIFAITHFVLYLIGLELIFVGL